MHRQTLRTWFSRCSLALTVAACSSTNVDSGANDGGSGGASGSEASGGTGTTGGKTASGKGGSVGAAGQPGVAKGGSSATGGSANTDAGAPADAGSGNSAQTIQIGERMNGSTYYIGMTYTQTDAHTLHATIVCNTSPSNLPALDYNYTFVPGTLTPSVVGSEDVMTFPAQ